MKAAGRFLTGKVCLVTGAAQGVGWALAQALADAGATVYGCDISQDNLDAAGREIAGTPLAQVIHLSRCDVADRKAIESWIAETYAKHCRIDVLINNAALVCWQDVGVMSVEQAERTMRVSYDGMVYAIKAVLPLMQKANQGHIINMSSWTGRLPTPPASAAYAAAKAAIDAYSQVLGFELAGSPIVVTLVRPATIAGTDFFRKHVPSSRMFRLTDYFPYLTPPDVARAVVQAIYEKRPILDLPGSFTALCMFYTLAPRLFLRAISVGGSARRDLGSVAWRYKPQEEK